MSVHKKCANKKLVHFGVKQKMQQKLQVNLDFDKCVTNIAVSEHFPSFIIPWNSISCKNWVTATFSVLKYFSLKFGLLQVHCLVN